MILRNNRNGDGQFIGCSSYPGCNVTFWLPRDLLRDVKVLDRYCQRCRTTKILEFKFKHMSTLALLGCTEPHYRGCVTCDRKLRDVLGLNDQRPTGNGAGGFQPPPPPGPPRNNAPNPSQGHSTWGSGNTSNSTWRGNQNSAQTNGWGATNHGPSGSKNRQPPTNPPGPKPKKPKTLVDLDCKCGKKATLLTTKKEGPNKDRQFYTCSQKACDFFKWADQVTPSISGASSDSAAPKAQRAKRKCGKCRQEGHTRKNCPNAPDDDDD